MHARNLLLAALFLAMSAAHSQAQNAPRAPAGTSPGIDTRDTSSNADASAIPDIPGGATNCVDRVTGAVRSGRAGAAVREPGAAPAGLAPPRPPGAETLPYC
jgi:hypothetical protein